MAKKSAWNQRPARPTPPSLKLLLTCIVCAWLMFIIFQMLMILTGGLIGYFSSSSPEHLAITITSRAFPYVVCAIFLSTYCVFMVGVWKIRHAVSRLTRYTLILIGGIVIPIGVSLLQYFDYMAWPSHYSVSDEALTYYRQLNHDLIISKRSEIDVYSATARSIQQVLDRRTRLGPAIRLIDGPPTSTNCTRVALESRSNLMCFSLSVRYTRRGYRVEIPKFYFNATERGPSDGVELAGMITTADFYCSVRREIFSGSYRRSEVNTGGLLRCLATAKQALEARIQEDRELLRRIVNYPIIPYPIVLLDSISEIVGAEYSVLEPISPDAGMIGVLGSVLTLGYFLLFASLVLEAASSRKRGTAQLRSHWFRSASVGAKALNVFRWRRRAIRGK